MLLQQLAEEFDRIVVGQERPDRGYRLIGKAAQGLAAVKPSPGALFAEPWIEEYGLLDELAVNAALSGHPRASADACEVSRYSRAAS